MGGQFLKALDAAEHTDVGLVRQKNEDTSKILIPPPGAPEEAWGALFMVVDGMGGLGGGDVASQFAVEEIARHYYGDQGSSEDTQTFESSTRLYKALQVASEVVRDQAPRLGLPRIGATAAGLALTPSGDVVIFNVGDCRVYRLRKGAIERVSRDQSVMERQIEAGLAPEFSAQATRSSMVTAFLGQPIPLQPNLRKDKVELGDVYIICSDGLWSLVDANEIARIVRTSRAQIAARNLIKLALKRGGHDNVTVIVIRLGAVPGRLGGFLRRLVAALVFAVILTVGALALNMVITPGSTVLRSEPGSTASPVVTTGANATALAPLPITRTATVHASPTNTPSPIASMTPQPTETPSEAILPTQTSASMNTPISVVDTPGGKSQTATGQPTISAIVEGPTVTLNPYVASYTPTPRPTKTSTPTLTPTPAMGSYHVIGTAPVKAYRTPYTDATVVTTLQPGDVIEVIAVVQGGGVQGRNGTRWLRFLYKGAYTYIHSSYAEFIGGTPTPQPVTLNNLPV